MTLFILLFIYIISKNWREAISTIIGQ